jgi:hypothetical protein
MDNLTDAVGDLTKKLDLLGRSAEANFQKI